MMDSKRNKLFFLIYASCLMLLKPAFAFAQDLPSFADLVETLIPSVVNISAISPDDRGESLGSGFIVSEDGYIVTNAHVIDKASDIKIVLSDGTSLPAVLKGQDKKTDIALLKVTTAKKLIPAKFGDSDKMRIGDWVLAIGNPFGLGGSVTAGIISAKERDIEIGPYDSFFQTDAAINQGSSGGPMFNLSGEVIGVSTALFSTTGASQGVGFAIPSNLSSWVVNRLKAKGIVERGWIGIRIRTDEEGRMILSSVTEGGPAQIADIKAGDIIAKVDDLPVGNAKNFSRRIAKLSVGKKIKIDIIRNGEPLSFEVTVEKMPEETIVKNMDESKEYNLSELAIDVGENQSGGLIVNRIKPGSDAEKKGLRLGDTILKIDRNEVLYLSDARGYINEAKMENNRPVLLTVTNGDSIHLVGVKLEGK